MGEHPVLKVLGAMAAIATIISLLVQLDVIPWPFSRTDTTAPGITFGPPCTNATISISQGSGPSGTEVVVTGTNFPADQQVDIRFHTEAMVPSETDDNGGFQVQVVIPGTFDAFAPAQFEIRALTSPALCSESASFELTP